MLKIYFKLNTFFLLIGFLINVISVQPAEAQTKQQQRAKAEQLKAYNQGPDQRQLNQQKANSGQGTSYKPNPGVNQQEKKSPYTVGNQQLNNDSRIKNSIKENTKYTPPQTSNNSRRAFQNPQNPGNRYIPPSQRNR
jgi:hypothetical protein